MKNTLKIFFVLLIVIVFSLLVFSVLYFTDNAGNIKEVTVTNLSSNSATISWVSDDYSIGKVLYSNENNWLPFIFVTNGKQEISDDRDVAQASSGEYVMTSVDRERKTHHVTLRDLEPSTTYYFKVGNGNRYFDGEIVSFTTSEVVGELRAPNPVYGIVDNFVDEEAEPSEAIIYYYLYDNNDITKKSKIYSSTLNAQELTWSGDLGLITDEKGNLFPLKKEYKVDVFVKSDKGYGKGVYDLDGFKPLPTTFVNIRYISEQ